VVRKPPESCTEGSEYPIIGLMSSHPAEA
jgi:hypothetical protein